MFCAISFPRTVVAAAYPLPAGQPQLGCRALLLHAFSGSTRIITPLTLEDARHVVGQSTAGNVQFDNGIGQHAPLVDGHCLGHAVTGLEHDTCGAAGGKESQHSLKQAAGSSTCGFGGVSGAANYLDGHVHGRHVQVLEHDLRLEQGSVALDVRQASLQASMADLGHPLPFVSGVHQRCLSQQHRVLLCAHAISN
jgi:hypothetical protein